MANLKQVARWGLWCVCISWRNCIAAASVGGLSTALPAESSGAIAESTNAPRASQTVANRPIPAFQLFTNDCVVFIGGTATVGDAKYSFVEALLTARYPGKNIRFRNMAWEGDTVFRQDRPLNFGGPVKHLTDQGATVLFLNFGLMESVQPDKSLADFVQAYKLLLDELGTVTERIVLVSPMRLDPPGPLRLDLTRQNEKLRAHVAAIRDLAQERGLFFVDLFKLRDQSEPAEDRIAVTSNGIHPSPYGYWRSGYEIEQSLGLPQSQWLVDIDAASKKHKATGTQISGFEIAASGLRFRAADPVLPGPVYRRDESSLSIWKGRVLRVAGLAPGRYALKIDGRTLYEKSHRFWENGWMLTHGPEMNQAEDLRALIVEKNQLFFDYWRPQNWAFLNGDLIEQPSSRRHDDFKVRWFPDEMKGFAPLIKAKETQVNQLAMPVPHLYELSRID